MFDNDNNTIYIYSEISAFSPSHISSFYLCTEFSLPNVDFMYVLKYALQNKKRRQNMTEIPKS